jgi:hypothetical protein
MVASTLTSFTGEPFFASTPAALAYSGARCCEEMRRGWGWE